MTSSKRQTSFVVGGAQQKRLSCDTPCQCSLSQSIPHCSGCCNDSTVHQGLSEIGGSKVTILKTGSDKLPIIANCRRSFPASSSGIFYWARLSVLLHKVYYRASWHVEACSNLGVALSLPFLDDSLHKLFQSKAPHTWNIDKNQPTMQ